MNIQYKINKFFKDNRTAHTQAERTKVIYKNLNLIEAIRKRSDKVDSASTTGSDPDNYYQRQLSRLTNWVANGRGPKAYRAKYPNENPSKIKDNQKTNNRIYQGRSNYYIKPKLKPTKNELKNPRIRQIVQSLHEYRKTYGNRFKIAKAIRETQDDLNEAIKSNRGINHTERKDNEPSPQPKELVDHIDLKDLLQNNPLLKAHFDGYSEIEISKQTGISRSDVSYRLQKCYNQLKN